jgi:hypothetical protein
MAADDDYAWDPREDPVADNGPRPADDAEALAHDHRAAPPLDQAYLRLREILHRTRAGSNTEPSPRLPGMEAY